MKKELVRKHREALSHLEETFRLVKGCAVTNNCEKGVLNCHDCPRVIACNEAKKAAEDVPVVTTVKPMQDFEKLFQEEKAKHDKLKEIVAEYQTSAKLSNEAVDQLKKERSQLKTDIKDLQEIANGYEQHGEELNEQLIAERENDELVAEYNMIKAKYERLKSFAKPIVTEFVESL